MDYNQNIVDKELKKHQKQLNANNELYEQEVKKAGYDDIHEYERDTFNGCMNIFAIIWAIIIIGIIMGLILKHQ